MGGRRDPKSVPYHLRETDPDLYNFLLDFVHIESDGVPGGVTTTTPSTINAGDSADIGTESLGWSPGDHEHAVATESATGLANANAEGSSTSLARADHAHKRDVRVSKAAVDVGTRNQLNFADSSHISVTVTDVPASDRVSVAMAIVANSVGNTEIRQGTACSVIGRSANSTGNVADIAASTNAHFLSRHSDALSFAAIVYEDLPASAQHWTRTSAIVHLTNANDTVSVQSALSLEAVAMEIGGDGTLLLRRHASQASAAPKLFFGRAQGSEGAFESVLSGDILAEIDIEGCPTDGGVFHTGGAIFWHAAEDWTNTNRGTQVAFFLNPLGASTQVERLRITPGGVVQPGSDAAQNLGATSLRWADTFSEQFYGGQPDPTQSGAVNSALEAAGTGFMGEMAVSGATESVLYGAYRARGSLGSLSASSVSDVIAEFRFHGHRSSAYSEGARIASDVEGITNQLAGRINFHTRPDLAMGGVLTLRFAITAAGNIVIGDQTNVPTTTATNGFLYIPACAGTPTGVPTAYTGTVPIIYDSTNNILYAYSGGAWRTH